jgi:hypothetical protein
MDEWIEKGDARDAEGVPRLGGIAPESPANRPGSLSNVFLQDRQQNR